MENTNPIQDQKEQARQLRKPQGSNGLIIGKHMNVSNKHINLHTIATVNPSSNDRILEVGMGNGFFVKNIVNVCSIIKYHGIDYSDAMVKEANRINSLAVKNKKAEFVNACISSIPYKDSFFNKIFTINTLYFWENPIQVLTELKRVLKEDGEIIIAFRPKHNLEKFEFTQFDFSLYTKEQLINLLYQNNLLCSEITEIKEPQQEVWGKIIEREAIIIKCIKMKSDV